MRRSKYERGGDTTHYVAPRKQEADMRQPVDDLTSAVHLADATSRVGITLQSFGEHRFTLCPAHMLAGHPYGFGNLENIRISVNRGSLTVIGVGVRACADCRTEQRRGDGPRTIRLKLGKQR